MKKNRLQEKIDLICKVGIFAGLVFFTRNITIELVQHVTHFLTSLRHLFF